MDSTLLDRKRQLTIRDTVDPRCDLNRLQTIRQDSFRSTDYDDVYIQTNLSPSA
jgi:acetylglutamate synthase